MIGKVNIHGHIGPSYVDPKGQLHKGVELLDVIEQCESFPQATILEVSVISPGGYADIGDSIYDYIVSLKSKGKQIVTIQDGLIGSIATKIFLSGDRRVGDKRYKFWIHNPFMDNVSGDQDQLREMAKSLEETEKNLRKFYAEFTPITDEGLDGLMKIETGLTADQCLKFGFATENKSVPAFNLINMKKDEKSFIDHVKAFFNEEKVEKKGVAPKAQVPGNSTKSLVVNLADGAGSFWVEAEAIAEGVGAFLLDESGAPTAEPLADGEYIMDDGSKVTVLGGIVTAVEPVAEDKSNFTKEEAEAMVKDAVEKALATQNEVINKVREDAKQESEKAIMALKKDLKLGIQPKVGFLSGGQKEEFETISQIQLRREQERKKSKFNVK